MRSGRPLHALALALVLALAACGGRDVMPEKVRTAYEQFMEHPDAGTYLGFIQDNRTAAMEHALTDDVRGVTHQLWALEVQSIHAEATRDLRLAQDVVGRIDELEARGTLEVYDEVVTGTRERLVAARERVAGMLE